MSILKIDNLTISIGGQCVLDNISFEVGKGEVLALVGASGSGKTMTAYSILRLLPPAARIDRGAILFKEQDLVSLDEEPLRAIRGRDISMVFQEPFTSLNPVMKVYEQIYETIAYHTDLKKQGIEERLYELLSMVKLDDDVAGKYPHELSGGMRQRVMLAMALSSDPELLILDEPTTALDVSVQKHVLDLIKEIQDRKGISILFITHDFSVVNMIADKVCVMKSGTIVEAGDKDQVLKNPESDYTRKLIESIPRLGDERERL